MRDFGKDQAFPSVSGEKVMYTKPRKTPRSSKRKDGGYIETYSHLDGGVVLKKLDDFIQKTAEPGPSKNTFSTASTSLSSAEVMTRSANMTPTMRTSLTPHTDRDYTRQERGDAESPRYNRQSRREEFLNMSGMKSIKEHEPKSPYDESRRQLYSSSRNRASPKTPSKLTTTSNFASRDEVGTTFRTSVQKPRTSPISSSTSPHHRRDMASYKTPKKTSYYSYAQETDNDNLKVPRRNNIRSLSPQKKSKNRPEEKTKTSNGDNFHLIQYVEDLRDKYQNEMSAPNNPPERYPSNGRNSEKYFQQTSSKYSPRGKTATTYELNKAEANRSSSRQLSKSLTRTRSKSATPPENRSRSLTRSSRIFKNPSDSEMDPFDVGFETAEKEEIVTKNKSDDSNEHLLVHLDETSSVTGRTPSLKVNTEYEPAAFNPFAVEDDIDTSLSKSTKSSKSKRSFKSEEQESNFAIQARMRSLSKNKDFAVRVEWTGSVNSENRKRARKPVVRKLSQNEKCELYNLRPDLEPSRSDSCMMCGVMDHIEDDSFYSAGKIITNQVRKCDQIMQKFLKRWIRDFRNNGRKCIQCYEDDPKCRFVLKRW